MTRAFAFMNWAVKMWGIGTVALRERALRLAEEAIELAQAEGVDCALVEATVKRVYGRPAGNPAKEYNQVALLTEAYGEAKRYFDPATAAQIEWERIQAIPKEEWRRRHDAKRAAGIIS